MENSVSTFSIVVGDPQKPRCNACCPYCVAEMTSDNASHKDSDEEIGVDDIDWINFHKACRFAQINQVSSVLFTGKGEPTLYPDHIGEYLEQMQKYNFPFVDLQTNGLVLDKIRQNGKCGDFTDSRLDRWRNEAGLSTIAISIAHYDSQKNAQIFTPHASSAMDLDSLIAYLRHMGFSVRLCCTMAKGYIDRAEEVINLADYAKANDVQQLTIRAVAKPLDSRNEEVYNWVVEHQVDEVHLMSIGDYLESEGHYLMSLAHGAPIYDLHGQNICFADCLRVEREKGASAIQMQYWPDGRIRYDWQFEGAVLL